jgi:hypothetical protein
VNQGSLAAKVADGGENILTYRTRVGYESSQLNLGTGEGPVYGVDAPKPCRILI